METLGTVWVCDCCLFAREGDGCEGQDHEHKHEPWSCWTNDESPYSFTVGLTDDEHACGVPFAERDECSCERWEFSHRECEACGSPLAGSRSAYTMWA